MNTPLPSSTDRIRLTISVSPEVHATFTRLANASSMSISRAMGDWLADTIEAAEFMATKMEEARSAPKRVIREMHGYALGLCEETTQLMDQFRQKASSEREAQREAAASAPRPVIRGVKSPSPGKKYSALDPSGNRVLLEQGQYFDKSGVLRRRKVAK